MRVGAEKARQNLSKLIDDAGRGETVIIEKHGSPKAMLVSIKNAPEPDSGESMVALAGSGAGLWGKSPSQYVEKLRGEWE
ncbi:MAG: type II toxin-antitoxin system prevent-host-death family antitoxin [Myxococcota bacterium]|jgi:prevent-host-death family protein